MIAIIYNWKGLKEENYLYTDSEMQIFDPDLFIKCASNKGDWIESALCTCASKTWEGVYIHDDDVATITQFLSGKFNSNIEEMKINNPDINYDDWYWENVCDNDLYGQKSNTILNQINICLTYRPYGEKRKKNMQKTTYEVWGIGYDEENRATTYENCFGEYETIDKAKQRFETVSTLLPKVIFANIPNSTSSIDLRIEKCIEHKNGDVECADILDECVIQR